MFNRVTKSIFLLAVVSSVLARPIHAESLDAMTAMLQRTSVRAFDASRKVTDGELRQIMEAGWNTRTLDGSRPFEFIQIRDKETLTQLAGSTKFAKWLTKAPAAIAVLVRTKESPRLFQENGAMAVMNMYYKAQELGLGTVFQGTASRKGMKKILGVGDNRHLLSVIPIGAPKAGMKFKSPDRVQLSSTLWQEKIGRPATMLDNTTPRKTVGHPMKDFLGPQHNEVFRFQTRPVESDKLRTAFEAMRAAPSSKNRQPWRWVLVKDKVTKQRIAKAAKDRTLAEAPVVAVLAGSLKPPPARFGSQVKKDPHNKFNARKKLTHFFMNHDISCALTNLRTGLESQGVGARVAMFNRKGESKVRAALSIGRPINRQHIKFMGAVGIGYAAKTTTRTISPMPRSRVYKGKFGR